MDRWLFIAEIAVLTAAALDAYAAHEETTVARGWRYRAVIAGAALILIHLIRQEIAA